MKKILIAMIITAMLLSLGVVFTSAITLPGKGYVDFSEGMYCVENPNEFSPVGEKISFFDFHVLLQLIYTLYLSI